MELVGLVAGEFTVAIGFDARWVEPKGSPEIDDADLDSPAVQEGCQIQAPVACGFHAGVHGCVRVEAMACEPDEELLEAGLRVGKSVVARTLADQQGHVELGAGDVDAEAVHKASEPVVWLRPCQPPLQSGFPAGRCPGYRSAQRRTVRRVLISGTGTKPKG